MVLDNIWVLLSGSAGVRREARWISHIEVFQQIDFQLRRFVLAASPARGTERPQYHDNTQFSFGEVRQLDLLHCNSLTSIPVQCSINRSEGTFPQTVTQLLSERNPLLAFPPICGHATRGNFRGPNIRSP